MRHVRLTLAARSIGRGLIKRCPVCGSGRLFKGWFDLKPSCPRCQFDFEREPGWWIGGMLINTCAAIVLFLFIAGGGVWIFWPDVPWTAITIASMLSMIIFPIWFYPISKTLWLSLDLVLGGLDESVRE